MIIQDYLDSRFTNLSASIDNRNYLKLPMLSKYGEQVAEVIDKAVEANVAINQFAEVISNVSMLELAKTELLLALTCEVNHISLPLLDDQE